MNPRQAAALAYIAHGWSVIPVRPNSNRPDLLSAWKPYQERLATEAEIGEWWENWPAANLGVVTGRVSDLTVVDVDERHGGVESAKTLSLPHTWTVRTPHGWHLYYRYTPDIASDSGYLNGLDIKNDGGVVTAPPSTRAGATYKALKLQTADEPFMPATLPEAVIHALLHEKSARHPPVSPNRPRDPSWVLEAMQGVGEGQRNETAARLAGYFHSKGLSPAITLEALKTFASTCSPPMSMHELQAVISSIDKYPLATRDKGGILL